jgi:hypothetical protein
MGKEIEYNKDGTYIPMLREDMLKAIKRRCDQIPKFADSVDDKKYLVEIIDILNKAQSIALIR